MPDRAVPLIMNLGNQPCLVVGAGRIGTRRALWLLDHGLAVHVIAPSISSALQEYTKSSPPLLEIFREPYSSRDLATYQLVVSATDDPEINALVGRDSRRAAILFNRADDSEASSFFFPSTLQRGPLEIAVTTAGSSPSLAKKICTDLAEMYPSAYGLFVETLGTLRDELKNTEPDSARRQSLLRSLATSPEIPLWLSLAPRDMPIAIRSYLDRLRALPDKKESHP